MGTAKMSKSLGNVLYLPDIIAKGFSPLDLRYYFLSVHYRTQLKFSWKGMEDARKARRKIMEWMGEADSGKFSDLNADAAMSPYADRFIDSMNSDLNTPAALAAVFDCMTWSRKNSGIRNQKPEPRNKSRPHDALLAFIRVIRSTFGCFEPDTKDQNVDIPLNVLRLVDDRERARMRKDFAESDRLRDLITDEGFDLRDSSDGVRIIPLRV